MLEKKPVETSEQESQEKKKKPFFSSMFGYSQIRWKKSAIVQTLISTTVCAAVYDLIWCRQEIIIIIKNSEYPN